jgi:predicted small metal-binding protein
MPYNYDCPEANCEYSALDNDMEKVIEDAQQHEQDKHGRSATRDDVEERVMGP